MDASSIKAVVFDYGNTLIEFGPTQVQRQRQTLRETLEDLLGPCDVERMNAVRDRQIVAPFSEDLRENEMATICAELIREVYGTEPRPEHVDRLVQARYDTFVDVIQNPSGVLAFLERLAERYRLALLSNYPCGRAIVDSMKKIGLADVFSTIVVSGDVGYVKPHPRPFELVLEGLAVSPGDCLFVGDNWLADIQGAKRFGMRAVLTNQYRPYETFEPGPGDHEPDLRIEHLEDLESVLLR